METILPNITNTPPISAFRHFWHNIRFGKQSNFPDPSDDCQSNLANKTGYIDTKRPIFLSKFMAKDFIISKKHWLHAFFTLIYKILVGNRNKVLECSLLSLMELSYQLNCVLTGLPTDHGDSIEILWTKFSIFFNQYIFCKSKQFSRTARHIPIQTR